MAQYVTVPRFVEAWRVPFWGRPADEPMPAWLVVALQSGAILVNHLGGLTRETEAKSENCYCGDYAVLDADDATIRFVSATQFACSHERVRV